MIKNNYIRIARHDWRCCKCGAAIKAGQEYRDTETKTYFITTTGCTGVNIQHERTCIKCPRTRLVYPEIMATADGTKERVLGVVMSDNDLPMFLTQDWGSSKYYFRDKMYDYNGALHLARSEYGKVNNN